MTEVRCHLCPNLWEYDDTVCTDERISHLCRDCWDEHERIMHAPHIMVIFGIYDHSGAAYRIRACENTERMRQLRLNAWLYDPISSDKSNP